MKNWKTIANCNDQNLRNCLISANGDIAEGLRVAFPQYFLVEGEKHPCITREEFLLLAKEMVWSDEVVKTAKSIGLVCKSFRFAGMRAGWIEGVPYSEGTYSTLLDGRFDYFHVSTKKYGEKIKYEGATWVVAFNSFSAGEDWSFAAHMFVIVQCIWADDSERVKTER